MNCPKCNTSNLKGSNFCKACGYDLKLVENSNNKKRFWENLWFKVLIIPFILTISFPHSVEFLIRIMEDLSRFLEDLSISGILSFFYYNIKYFNILYPTLFEFLFPLYVFYVFLYLISRLKRSTQPLKFTVEVMTAFSFEFFYLIFAFAILKNPNVFLEVIRNIIAKKKLYEGLGLIFIPSGSLFFSLVVLFPIFVGPGYLLLKKLEKKALI
jgi:hypothetical protein